MPEEYVGEHTKKSAYVKTQPRRWSIEEVEWLLESKKNGFSNEEIANSMGRSEVSISIKMKRLSKSEGSYNKGHVIEKYETNSRFIDMVNPASVLDVYCGELSYYKTNFPKIKTTSNDKDKNIVADYNMDALKFICLMYQEGKKYDIVDLDPFGSAYESFSLAIKMAKKGVIITLGELGHKRFTRVDFVSRMYGINDLEEFTTENLVGEIVKIGKQSKKLLTPVFIKEWNGISRVWFAIEDIKIIGQWEEKSQDG